ncbi:MAG: efflux RND transporter periplasmic adaptor subunit [Deltaproteobacteria bacterium]|nr:efflux RND transporter periplasmic adaptor subunit [Deltaproteobacteria bacterium]
MGRVFQTAFACLALLGAAAGCSKHAQPPPAIVADEGVQLRAEQLRYITVGVVESDTQGAVIRTTGHVAYDEDHVARLAVPVSGRIAKVQARPGDEVKVGQTLAVIHSPDVAAAAASLAQDRAQRIQSEQALARSQRLLASGAGSERELQEARVNLVQAKAAEDKDVATLRVLGGGSADPSPVYNLRSPIAGTVTERHATLGGGVRSDDPTPLFVVGDLSHLWVQVDIFEQDIALVQKGARVEVTVPSYPDRVFVGAVAQIGDTVDPTTRTIHVRISMSNEDRLLKPEMFARVTVASPGRRAVRVPVGAVLTKADKTYAFVEDTPQHFVPRTVVVGARQDGSLQVLSGLKEGERVVTHGGLLLDAEMTQRL